jgi:hypothetical protein
MQDSTQVSGEHKAEIRQDALHAAVVVIVVVCTTVLYFSNRGVPADVLSGVYLGAIAYAAGRSGSLSRPQRRGVARATDPEN